MTNAIGSVGTWRSWTPSVSLSLARRDRGPQPRVSRSPLSNPPEDKFKGMEISPDGWMDGWMDGTHSGRGRRRRRFHFHSRNAHAMRERQGIIPVTHAPGGDEGASVRTKQHFDITCVLRKTIGHIWPLFDLVHGGL